MTFKITLCAGFAALTFSTATLAQDTSYTVALDGTFAPHAMPSLSGGV